MSPLRIIYLALAAAGTVSAAAGWLAPVASRPVWPGDAAAWNTLIAAAALAVWALAETWVRRNWLALVAIPATALAGPGCGLPLYLFLRTRPVG